MRIDRKMFVRASHWCATKQSTAVALGALVALLCGWQAPQAAIVFDSASSTNANSNIVTFQHTTGPGLDRILVVGVSVFSANKPVGGITYGGVPLTFLGAVDGGSGSNNRRTELWYLVAPAIGTAPIVITMGGGSKVVVGAATYFGVDPLTPVSGFSSAEGSSTTASISVPGGAGEVVVDCITTKGAALSITPGANQTELWNGVTRTNGGNVMGGGSYAAGASPAVMSWTLQNSNYWVMGATSLLPAPPRPYLVDAMVKLAAEPDAAYRYDAVYEAAASVQTAADGALNGVSASYNVRFENDGFNADQFVVSGTASSPLFSVQYFDGAGVDRTAAVIGGGYTDLSLAPGASTVWTINVTPVLSTPGGTSFPVTLTATSSGDATIVDQVAAVTVSVSPLLSLSKSVDLANAAPGQDLTYAIVATTAAGLSDATALGLVDPVPGDVGFQIGSVTFDPGSTSLTATIQYSNDNGATWAYVPGTGGCSAPLQYDYCVTHVRWELSGTMPADQSFIVSFAGRVK
jgi:uncharacterized repeat protein (TIGR01451 family)